MLELGVGKLVALGKSCQTEELSTSGSGYSGVCEWLENGLGSKSEFLSIISAFTGKDKQQKG